MKKLTTLLAVAVAGALTQVSFAVVGGTGTFAGASGQVTGAPALVDGQPTSRLTFELAKK